MLEKHNAMPFDHEPDGSFLDMLIVTSGMDLPESQAAALELALERDANDLKPRLQLLGYHFTKMRIVSTGSDPKGRDLRVSVSHEHVKQRHKHVCWYIRNRPFDYVCGTPHITSQVDPGFEQELKTLWSKHLEELAGANPLILKNAGMFFLHVERTYGKTLLEEAFKQIPDDAELQGIVQTINES